MPGVERNIEALVEELYERSDIPPTSNLMWIFGYFTENATMASPTSLLPIHLGLMIASCPSALSRRPRSCASSLSISSMIREANSAYLGRPR